MKIEGKDEKGGILVIVAMITSAALFFGVLALVVDSGIVYVERRTVQGSAETAALSMARECIEKPSTCATSSIAQEIANANSTDSLTRITEVCVNGKNERGASCRGLTGQSIDCSPIAESQSNFVRIRSESQSKDQASGISTIFANSKVLKLIGCAQARWGNASSASVTTPFAVSICEWSRQQALPRVLTEFQSSAGVADCIYTFTDYAGNTYTRSGINGWAALDLQSASLSSEAKASTICPDPSIDRPAYLHIGDRLNQITRDQSSPNYCGTSDLISKMPAWTATTLYIPLVSTVKLSGGSTVHTIEAFAAFKLLGYSLLKGNGNSSNQGGTTPSGSWCPKNTNCLYGEFIRTISPGSEIDTSGNSPNIGLQAIELT